MEDSSIDECGFDRATPAFAQRRQFLIDCLHQFDEPVSLPDLADEIAIREAGQSLSSIPGERVKDVYLALYHRHIPELVEDGHIEYDQDADLVFITDDWNPDVAAQYG